jgi:hypothetical protein
MIASLLILSAVFGVQGINQSLHPANHGRCSKEPVIQYVKKTPSVTRHIPKPPTELIEEAVAYINKYNLNTPKNDWESSNPRVNDALDKLCGRIYTCHCGQVDARNLSRAVSLYISNTNPKVRVPLLRLDYVDQKVRRSNTEQIIKPAT